jgi:aminoglycoside/choline kinase family phosphotransferase
VSGGTDDALRARMHDVLRASVGRDSVRLDAISPGLGARRFFRATFDAGQPGSLIVRVEPDEPPALAPGIAPEPAMEPIRQYLAQQGLPVPARLGGDDETGITLLEDLGDESLERIAKSANAAHRSALYDQACDLIPRLQSLHPPEPGLPAFERRLDPTLVASKAAKWIDWALPALLGRDATVSEGQIVRSAFAFIADVVMTAPARLAHRDFKAANLHWRSAGGAGSQLVMIDFQGAFLAPPEYDLVCLLRDSHVPLDEHSVAAHCARIRPQLPDAPSADEFARRFDLLTLARVAKDLSHYLDAARSRGDSRYVAFVPNGLSNLRAASARAAERDTALTALAEHIASIPSNAAQDLSCAP